MQSSLPHALTGWGWEEEGGAAVEAEAVGALNSPTGSPASGAHPLHREHMDRKAGNKQLSTKTNRTAPQIEFFLMKASERIQHETAESFHTFHHPAC